MSSARVRQFEDLREEAPRARFGTWSLVVVGLACTGFSVLALRPSVGKSAAGASDPLAELAERQRTQESSADAKRRADKAKQLDVDEVTFPGLLSDGENPTTALAAVQRGKEPADARGAVSLPAPPPPTDRLPVVPLPARNVLAATPVVTRPRDTLTRVAAEKGNTSTTEQAPAGHEGRYQLQVSSFRTREEADKFSLELRGRGHKAYVVAAEAEGRGTWYRVRIGPFTSQAEAVSYRSAFEAKERVVPFVVLPPKPTEARTELAKESDAKERGAKDRDDGAPPLRAAKVSRRERLEVANED